MEINDKLLSSVSSAMGAKSPISIQRMLLGKSGAGVWLVDAQLPHWSGVGILKLEQIGSYRRPESQVHVDAVNASPDFAKKHFATLVGSTEVDGYSVSLFEAAGGGLENCRPLRTANATVHKTACEELSEGLLRGWNIAAKEGVNVLSESELLQTWLGYRLLSFEGGRIQERCASFGISGDTKAFSYGGVTFPNPYYWANAKNLQIDGGIRPILGFLHSDLHADNVLIVNANGVKVNYLVIDFALAEGEMPLLYDQAYLEFSSILNVTQSADIALWAREMEKLSNVTGIQDLLSQDVDLFRIPVAHSIAAIRHIYKSWANDKFGARKAQIYRQQILARVAVGLNFLNKTGLEIDQLLRLCHR